MPKQKEYNSIPTHAVINYRLKRNVMLLLCASWPYHTKLSKSSYKFGIASYFSPMLWADMCDAVKATMHK